MTLVVLVMASLIYRCSLRNTVVVASPDDIRALWEVENALYGFPGLG
jgi:hypothetical protein